LIGATIDLQLSSASMEARIMSMTTSAVRVGSILS